MINGKYNMTNQKYREFDRTESIIHRWLAIRSTPILIVQLLNLIEKSGLRWCCTFRGYQQVNRITRKHYIIGLTLDFVGLLTIAKGFVVLFVSNSNVQMYLGDLFIGSSVHNIQTMMINMLLLLACGLRYFGFYTERKGRVEPLTLYYRLKSSAINCEQFKLTPSHCSSMRKIFYIFGQFYLIVTPITCFAISTWIIYAFYTNQINFSSTISLLTTGLWTIVTCTIFTLGAYPTIWLYIHISMIITFVTFSLASNQLFGKQLIVDKDQTNENGQSVKYLVQQNKIYNFIYQMTIGMGQVFCYGIIIVTGTGNFAMFVSLFIGTGSGLFDYFILAVGCMSFNSIVIINMLSSFTANQALICQKVNYQIGRHCKLDLKTQLKLLSTCERINIHRIGFSLGGLYTLDSYHFLLVS
ncbi:uncharacterized protein LOC128393191 [Panonychus citri]|uniref:uncharacterized protein LOC128393191 n=1 Tax=Panonychus citri TaxID=50023 RepID=UPI002307402E|nr:uncharacterized protein LOC128393191 [Panonychus citri]